VQIDSAEPLTETDLESVIGAVDAFLDARRVGFFGSAVRRKGPVAGKVRQDESFHIEVSVGALGKDTAALPLLHGMLRRRLDHIEVFEIRFLWDAEDKVPGCTAGEQVDLRRASFTELPVDFLRSYDVTPNDPGDPVHLEIEFTVDLGEAGQAFVKESFQLFDAVMNGGFPTKPSTVCGSIIGESSKWFLSPNVFVAHWDGILADEGWVVLIQNWLSSNLARLKPAALAIW
jgi:hypothetical protein